MDSSNASYLAGLFDGEGSVTYKQYMRKRTGEKKAYLTWNIQLEVSMTEEHIIKWIYETLNVGNVNKRPPHKTSMGKKMQYRWRCSHRDALMVAKAMIPYVKIKKERLKKIINHYENK